MTRLLRDIIAVFARLGAFVLDGLGSIGRLSMFAGRTLARAVRPPYYPARLLAQMFDIGWLSLPVVALTALFTGAALAQQIYVGGSRFNAASTVPAVTVIGIVRELGPVLASLMVAGRVASAMAAALAPMRVTAQVAALCTLRTDPYRYLIVPRLVAAVIVMPLVVLVANILGVFGGFVLATQRLEFSPAAYISTTLHYLKPDDIRSSLVKAAGVGFLLARRGGCTGFRSGGGAAGVGRATTNAVVSAFILILLSALIITVIAFHQ